ncbi:glucose 1-dehydrogenase [Kyrpidia sp.]|uniref:glucose 1-dehydrogenase n=1 Tax=Kyrpidia sp. TaxID=2073077 RepID=UPI00183081A6|nr:glucose 1-dehydrogenase [Kyrpidia sp.]MCL6577703.1 glucose 1-dehydrogenase [Kyrpidia sp.]HHY67696.1 glucose 1-dehydrogenase [Alicyclobacillus sp.]
MRVLRGKTAIITGAGRGIGRAIALALVRDGAWVCVNDVRRELAESVVREIAKEGGESFSFIGDVTDEEAVGCLVQECVQQWGHVDILVANAGIAQVKPALELTVQDWKHMLEVNVLGVVLCNVAAAKQMIRQGSGGKIINACSIAGQQGFDMLSHYSASKFAVRGWTQAFAKEVASYGITVNAYCPGIVDTDMWKQIDEEFSRINKKAGGETFREYAARALLGRPETPEDVAKLVRFLAGPEGDFITGQSIVVDGGIVFV